MRSGASPGSARQAEEAGGLEGVRRKRGGKPAVGSGMGRLQPGVLAKAAAQGGVFADLGGKHGTAEKRMTIS